MRALVLAAAVATYAIVAGAQPPRERVLEGDREYSEWRVSSALASYLAAIDSDPNNYEALWKASRTEIDIGELLGTGAARDSLYAAAARHAALAVAANPHDAEGHFAMVRAIGSKALSVGVMERIRYANVIRSEALEALRYDSVHAGSLHALGVWNAEVMRLNGLARAFARTFLGGQVFGLASWTEATRLLEKSVAVDPGRIGARLDLGVAYADMGNRARAREQFEWIARAPVREINDALYKRRAAERLKKL